MKKLKSHHRTNVFISYSHKDKKWLERLRRHLKPLERDYAIEIWDDTKIEAGAKWRAEIRNALESARVAVLLLSADFLASEFITSDELPPLLEAADEAGATILPVVVSPCRFAHTRTLSQFQAVNAPSKPLITMSTGERENLFVRLTEEIEAALGQQESHPAPARKKSRRKVAPGVLVDRQDEKKTRAARPATRPAAPAKPRPPLKQQLPAAVAISRPKLVLTTLYQIQHDKRVNCVAFSPDGSTLATANGGGGLFTTSGEVRLWQVSDGKLLKTLRGHKQGVPNIAFSPDGAMLASAAENTWLWSVPDGNLLRTLEGETCVAFSPDGTTLASGSETVRLWRTSDGKHLLTFEEHEQEKATCLAFSPDGSVLACGTVFLGSGVTPVRLLRVADGKLLRALRAHTGIIWDVAFSPDGSMLASASHDKSLCLWRVADGELLSKVGEEHLEPVNSVAFAPDGTILASGIGGEFWSVENRIDLWSVPEGKSLGNLQDHEKAVSSVAFSPDGAMLASGSYDKTVRVWRVK